MNTRRVRPILYALPVVLVVCLLLALWEAM